MQKHILQIVEARLYTRENGAGMRLLVNDRRHLSALVTQPF